MECWPLSIANALTLAKARLTLQMYVCFFVCSFVRSLFVRLFVYLFVRFIDSLVSMLRNLPRATRTGFSKRAKGFVISAVIQSPLITCIKFRIKNISLPLSLLELIRRPSPSGLLT